MTSQDIPAQGASERDIRPKIARPRAGVSGAMIGIGLVATGVFLFIVLDTHRRGLSAPAISSFGNQDIGSDQSPAPLYIPPEPISDQTYGIAPYSVPTSLPPVVNAAPRMLPPPPITESIPLQQQPIYTPPMAPQRGPRNGGGSTLVLDLTQPRDTMERTSAGGNEAVIPDMSTGITRARASTIANRSTTVPQGTIIGAILETALDSSHGSFARALVQRDITGFDGSRILIPRGSRLIGEYQGNAVAGQKRAFINWARLIRPDGVTINLSSPTTDPVGKGGVRAKVDGHFFERFSGAIVQSALDAGVNLATRAADSQVILALPGSARAAAPINSQAQISPTLSVRQGTSISVFVAHDLDFTDIEQRP